MQSSPPRPAHAATLRTYLNRHLGCELTEQDPLPFPTQMRQLARGEVVTRFGQVEHHAYFLNQGVLQICLLREGEEKIADFFFPGDFFCAYSSFLTQQPADVQLTALTPCTVEVLRHQDVTAAYYTSLLANQLGRFVTEQLYLRKVRREKDFLGRSAEERYADLFRQQPAFVRYLPVGKLARYLGIHPNSLSRIRRRTGLGAA